MWVIAFVLALGLLFLLLNKETWHEQTFHYFDTDIKVRIYHNKNMDAVFSKIDQIYKNGLSEGEVYPSKSIHNNSLYLDNIQGNVSLSEGQRKVLKKEASKRLNNFYKMINND